MIFDFLLHFFLFIISIFVVPLDFLCIDFTSTHFRFQLFLIRYANHLNLYKYCFHANTGNSAYWFIWSEVNWTIWSEVNNVLLIDSVCWLEQNARRMLQSWWNRGQISTRYNMRFGQQSFPYGSDRTKQ